MLQFFLLSYIKRSDNADEVNLIKQISDGNQAAIRELYDIYSGLLFNLIYRVVKKREDAEEVLQSVFMLIWEKAGTFDFSKGNVFSWLFRIARNKSIDKLRSKGYKTDAVLVDYLDDLKLDINDYVHTVDAHIAVERTHLIVKALNDLPDDQKKVIELAYYDGLTQTEISQELNIPLGTVKTRTRQALIKLETLLSLII